MRKLTEPAELPLDVQQVRKNIRNFTRQRPSCPCENCGGRQWHFHVERSRWFMHVVLAVVYPVLCVLCRWRCAVCGKTHIHYPPCCLPHKLYLREEVEGRCKRYVREERSGYRDVVTEQGMAVAHAGPVADVAATEQEKEAEETMQLAGSSVHRWIDGLASMAQRQPEVLKRAQEAGGQLARWAIAPWKYRRSKRRWVLTQCRIWLEALALVTNPTEYATGGASP